MKNKLIKTLTFVSFFSIINANNLIHFKNNFADEKSANIQKNVENFPKNFTTHNSYSMGSGENTTFLFVGESSHSSNYFNIVIVDQADNVTTALIKDPTKQNDAPVINSITAISDVEILVDTDLGVYTVLSNSLKFQVSSTSITNPNSKGLNSLQLAKLSPSLDKKDVVYIDKSHQVYGINYKMPFIKPVGFNLNENLNANAVSAISPMNVLVGGKLNSSSKDDKACSLYYVNVEVENPQKIVPHETAINNFKAAVNDIYTLKDMSYSYIAAEDGIYYFNNSLLHPEISSISAQLIKDHPDAHFQNVFVDESNNILYTYSISNDNRDNGLFSIDLKNNSYQRFDASEISKDESVKNIFVNSQGKINISTFNNASNFANFYTNVNLVVNNQPHPADHAGNNKLSSGSIAGIVLGSLIGVSAIGSGIYFYYKRKK